MSETQKLLYCLLMQRLGVYAAPDDISPWGDVQTATTGESDDTEP